VLLPLPLNLLLHDLLSSFALPCATEEQGPGGREHHGCPRAALRGPGVPGGACVRAGVRGRGPQRAGQGAKKGGVPEDQLCLLAILESRLAPVYRLFKLS